MYKLLVSSAPALSILNAQAFHYTSSAETDIRKTFARVQRGTAFARSAAAVPRMRDERAVSHCETVCVDAIPNDTPARADAAIAHSAGPAPILRSVDPRTSCPDPSSTLSTIPRRSLPDPSAIADASVWLECSVDLIDVPSVDVLRIREATPGSELIEFACPRCGTPHASLRFE